MTKTIKVHKRHTTFADTCITITGADLPCYRDWDEYSGYLSHIGSDAAFKSWWLADDEHDPHGEDVSATDAECVLAHGGVIAMPKHMPLGVRPILLFNSDLSRWEDGDTFVFVDTDFIVVDENEGVALSLTCVDTVPYQKLKVALDEWFDNRIHAPLNTYSPDNGDTPIPTDRDFDAGREGAFAFRCDANGRHDKDGSHVFLCDPPLSSCVCSLCDDISDVVGAASVFRYKGVDGYLFASENCYVFYPDEEGGNNP